MTEGHVLHHRVHRRTLCRVPFHEFQPGRGVVEQAADNDGRALRAAHYFPIHHLARFQRQASAELAAGGTGHQLYLRHSGDSRQGFTTEPQGTDGL